MAADSSDLVTLAQVCESMQIAVTDARAALIQSNITRASLVAQRHAEREFKTVFGTGDSSTPKIYDGVGTRTFMYRGGGVLSLAPYDLRSVTAVVLDNEGASPSTTTLTADDYRLMPLPSSSGSYTQLQIRGFAPPTSDSNIDYRTMRKVDITGTWGMATVPIDVVEAVILTVMHWVRMFSNFYASHGAGEQMDTDTAGRYVLPGAAKQLLDHYRHRAA